MDGLSLILHGYCTIELWQNISGNNFRPIYKVVGNTLIDKISSHLFNQHHWLRMWNPKTQSYYAFRKEKRGGKWINVYMAREVLNLCSGVGSGSGIADHKNHDTLDNREDNLRVVTDVQSVIHRRKWGSSQRFKGVIETSSGKWVARIRQICFTSVPTDVEAAFMRKEAGNVLFEGFDWVEEILPEEMPSEARQKELREMVFEKLRQKGFLVQ